MSDEETEYQYVEILENMAKLTSETKEEERASVTSVLTKLFVGEEGVERTQEIMMYIHSEGYRDYIHKKDDEIATYKQAMYSIIAGAEEHQNS
jgi:ATP-dependent Clp protease adapter protein ClpS